MDHMPKRRPTIAKEWQVAILKKLQSESSNPTKGQRSAAAAETGLDEKWVKNWFTRQRSKVAASSRKRQPSTTEPHQPRAQSATIPTFKLHLCYPPAVPDDSQGPPSRRSVSTPINPTSCSRTSSCREPSPASFDFCSPRSPGSTVSAQTMAHSHRSISIPMFLNGPPQNPTLAHTATIPAYSRDPLCDRYPDFSQFFRSQVHQQFRSSESSSPINNHNHLVQVLANPNMDSHVPVHFQGLFNLLDPLHLAGLPTHENSSAYSRTCPVAFSVRVVDLLGHS